jgi:protein tyrosine kinase modulator
MNEALELILGYLQGVWRRRWLVLVIAWTVSVVGWVWIYFLPNEYRAEARVYVDTQSLLRPLLSGLAVQPNVNQQVSLVARTLLSRPNLEKVARMTDLDLRAKGQRQTEELYADLSSRISLAGTDRENLYTISCIEANPEVGKRVVESLLTIFTESSLGGARKDLSTSQKFIDDQIADYEAKLLDKEKQIEEFKRRNYGQLPWEGKDFYASLSESEAALRQAQLELDEATNRKKQLEQQLADQDKTISVPTQAPASDSALDGRIAALQTQLDNLRLRYTDLHPEVQRTKQLIAAIQEQKRKEAEEAARNATPGSAKAQNPLYQQLSIAIAEADANAASLRTRVKELDGRRAEAMKSIDRIPQLQAEYTQLTRDYDQYKQYYAQLLERRQTAVFTGEVASKTDTVDIRVIDPPRVSNKPAKPNRPVLITATPAGGIAAGVALAFLLVQIRPTVHSRRQLRELTGLQLLGAVSRIETEGTRRRHRRLNLFYSAGLAALVLAYSTLMVYYLILSPAA